MDSEIQWQEVLSVTKATLFVFVFFYEECHLRKQIYTKYGSHYKHESYHIEAETNGRHFSDDIFKCIFLNENVLISIKISLKFVPEGQINNIPALV